MPTPTDLANLDRCAHRVYLDVAGDPAEKLPASAFLELLWETGILHEDRIIAALGAVDAKVSDDKAECVEVLSGDRDPAGLKVREREARDRGRREKNLPHVERREGRLGVREHPARRRIDEADVLEQVVALSLESREEECPARRRLVWGGQRQLGT